MFKPTLITLACLAGLAGAAWPAALAREAPRDRPLHVCLVSGAETYNTDEDFATLAEYLRREHGMRVDVLKMRADQKAIVGIERLLECDTAVFHVRRKTLDEENLAILKRFFDSGKGFVALRSTSHGWENWKDFDRTVLGAKYGGPGGNNIGDATALHFKPHPIWEGTEGFDTKGYLYRMSEFAPDIDIILEGESASSKGRMPVGWTRVRHGARLFYLALGRREDISRRPFQRAIANAIRWVTQPPREEKTRD